jgi:very-short-patch-repair endonuclease
MPLPDRAPDPETGEFDVVPDRRGERRTRPPRPAEIDIAVARLATGQEGVVGIAQARDRGLRTRVIEHRLGTGRMFGVHRGVYLLGHEATTFRGSAFAALQACGEDSVLSDLAAAAAWRAAPPPATIDVIVPPRTRRSRRGIRVHHRRLAPSEVVVLDGLRVTSPVRTLLDLASRLGVLELERVCAELMVANRLTNAELERAVRESRGRRGIVALRELALKAEPTRSETERAFLRALRESGLPRPIVNAPIRVEGLGRIRPDFMWTSARVIVETDAFSTHGGPSRFERDRERDAALTAVGWVVMRHTRRLVVCRPQLVVTQLAQVLALRTPSDST